MKTRSPLIDQYVEKYYHDWQEFTIGQSRRFNQPDKAYDILSDVLLIILQKPEDKLLPMLESDEKGGSHFKLYVMTYIKFAVLDEYYAETRVKVTDDFTWFKSMVDSTEEESLHNFQERRFVESMFRDDLFINPTQNIDKPEGAIIDSGVYQTSCVERRRSQNSPQVYYRVFYHTKDNPKRRVKRFQHRGSAIRWAIEAGQQ